MEKRLVGTYTIECKDSTRKGDHNIRLCARESTQALSVDARPREKKNTRASFFRGNIPASTWFRLFEEHNHSNAGCSRKLPKPFHSSSQEKAVFRRGLADTEFHEEIISGKSSFHSYCVDPSKTRFSRSTPWTYPCLKSTHLCPISKTQKSTYLLHTLAWEKLISTSDCPSPDLRCLPPIKFVPPKKRRHQDLRCKPQPSPSKPARCFRLPSYLVSASLRHSCAAYILRYRTTSVRAPFFRSSRQSRAPVHYYRLHSTPRGYSKTHSTLQVGGKGAPRARLSG